MAFQVEVLKKVALLGDPAVGKTSLIRRYVFDEFSDMYITTIGTKVSKKEVMVNDTIKVTMLIWDILGQDEFQFLHATYYQGSAGALIVCDGTRPETIDHLRKWVTNFFNTVGRVPVIFLVNKADILDRDTFYSQPLEDLCAEVGASWMFSSAKNGENVDRTFQNIASRIAESL